MNEFERAMQILAANNSKGWQRMQPYDPTAEADAAATRVRAWYEANRESWWQRHRPQIFSPRDNGGLAADNFILRLIEEVKQAQR